MKNVYLVITSIARSDHPALKQYAEESVRHDIPFIVIGDTKSPKEFELSGCDFYSAERQKTLGLEIAKILPYKHYARKNIGYLTAISKGAEIIIETDDDNYPLEGFWDTRKKEVNAHLLRDNGWINIYSYFTKLNIWPRGYSLINLQNIHPELSRKGLVVCPIQQGLADENPDVDAIYRLTLPLPVKFEDHDPIALGRNSICPFNSQNTTWFKEAFPLLYLPSYCSFRMTDIWRSFVAQRISWTCGWSILFHKSTVWQERNDHNLMIDFKDEISGYINNDAIVQALQDLDLPEGESNIEDNFIKCYEKLIEMKLIGAEEMNLIEAWFKDLKTLN